MIGKPAPLPSVLLIEASFEHQRRHRATLSAEGFEVKLASTGAEGLRLFRTARPTAVVMDLTLPDRDGLALMGEILALRADTRVIAVTTPEGVDQAVAAIRAGAVEVLQRPVADARLLAVLRHTLETEDLPRLTEAMRARASGMTTDPATFIGSSAAMAGVHRIIGSVARSMATVFITGESGTGKELAALAVHAQSARSTGPFIALNCGAIPPDLLESEVFGHVKGSFTGAISDKPGAAVAADGGTLFLDEICEMAPALQTKLLRFLQTSTVQPVGATRPRRVDVRIICATNRDPMDAVARGHFRQDLFYRLYVVPLHMPRLCERDQDVVEIAETALSRFAEEEGKTFAGLAPATRRLLLSQDWPGNVRQLLNVIRNVVVLQPGGEVTPAMLPPPHPAAARPEPMQLPEDDAFAGLTLAEVERRAIESALARHAGSVPRAARDLDVSPSTLYRKLQGWGIPAGR